MAMTKDDVRAAFRQAMALEFAGIPQEEEIDHTFSPGFCARMDALIAQQRRGSFRLLSRNKRRALVIAALLAVMLLLTGFTPAGQQLARLAVEFFEEFVDYEHAPTLRTEIKTQYALSPVPEGFALVSETNNGNYYSEKIYANTDGKTLVFMQTAGTINGTLDNERGDVLYTTVNDISILLRLSPQQSFASWIQDGYYMSISCYGPAEQTDLELWVASVSPVG